MTALSDRLNDFSPNLTIRPTHKSSCFEVKKFAPIVNQAILASLQLAVLL
ncbi:hypothetical protein [Lacunimicrobium album]